MSTVSPTPPDRAAAERAASRRVLRAISSGAALDECLRAVLAATHEVTGASTAAIGLRRDGVQVLEVIDATGANADDLRGMRIAAADSLADEALRTGLPALSRGIGTGAAAPIVCDGAITGALIAAGKAVGPFSPEDLESLGALAEHAAFALTIDEKRLRCAQNSRELAVLYDAAHTVSGTLNVQDVLGSILDTVCGHFGHQAALLYLLNDERTHLFIAAERGLTDEEREVQLSAQDQAIASILESGTPVVLDADPSSVRERADGGIAGVSSPLLEALTAPPGTRSALVAPIRSRSDTLGLLILVASHTRAYSVEDARLLGAVAAQSGVAIANAWLYEHATRRAEEATALYDLSQRIGAELQLDQVFGFVADSVVNLLKVDRFALMLYDPKDQRLRARITRGVAIEQFSRTNPRTGEGIPGWVFEWQTPTAVSDVAADSRNAASPIQATSAVCVPLSAGDHELGVLLGMSSRRRLFTVAEMELVYTLANQAAVAIVNATLYNAARARSVDMRRYFHRMARALGSALQGYDVPQLLADIALAVMRADRSVVYRAEGETASVQAASGFWASEPPDEHILLGDSPAGHVARRGRAVVIEDLEEDPGAQREPWFARERMTSYLGVPLKIGHRTVGLLEICTAHRRVFSEGEVRVLSQFAQRARVAERLVENRRP